MRVSQPNMIILEKTYCKVFLNRCEVRIYSATSLWRNIMSYLIKDTTREERAKLVKKALGISVSGAELPSNETLRIVKQYIDGEKELKEVQKEIIERYRK